MQLILKEDGRLYHMSVYIRNVGLMMVSSSFKKFPKINNNSDVKPIYCLEVPSYSEKYHSVAVSYNYCKNIYLQMYKV